MKTDPNAESPDIIDQRDPSDPSHFDPKPGDPSVTPGITLPTTIPDGWTIAPDGSMVPLAEPAPAPILLPEMTITASPPSSGTGAIVAVVIAVTAFFGFLWARGGR
jgi:hypothetical protein